MNGCEEQRQKRDINPPKHSAKLWDNASVFNYRGEGRVRRLCQQPHLPQSLPESQDSLFIFCSNTMSSMNLFTILKRKTRPRSASLMLLKSALEVTPSSTAGHGAGGRGKGLSHLPRGPGTGSHQGPGTLPLLTRTGSAAAGFRQAAHGARSQRRPCRQVAACLYRQCSVCFITFPVGPVWSGTPFAFRVKNLILSSESWGEVSSELSPGTLTPPSLLCTSSAASPASTDQPTGPGFSKPHFVRTKGGWAVPLSVLITATVQR